MNKNNQKGAVIGRSAMAVWEHATMYEEKDQEVPRSLEICRLEKRKGGGGGGSKCNLGQVGSISRKREVGSNGL
jgi:hypothetical protein